MIAYLNGKMYVPAADLSGIQAVYVSGLKATSSTSVTVSVIVAVPT